jgi:CHAT domain-containing protein/tetratricopeptide (TPR) repeat protein
MQHGIPPESLRQEAKRRAHRLCRLPWALLLLALTLLGGAFSAAEPPDRNVLPKAERLRQAAEKSREAAERESVGDYLQAERLYQEALATHRELLGDRHPDSLADLDALAMLDYRLGDFGQAEPRLTEALQIAREVYGEKQLDYAVHLNNLGMLYQARGDYARAEPRFHQALEVCRAAGAEHSSTFLVTLNNLAGLYHSVGDQAQAEALLEQVAAISRRVDGEKNLNYATCLNNLAGLYYSLADYRRAEPLFQQALELRKELLGTKHPDYATSLDNLAANEEALGDVRQAEPLYQQALAIRRDVLGTKHPEYATSLTNLAGLYRGKGEFERAEPLFREAMEVSKAALGEHHPQTIASLNNLAALYRDMRQPAKAEPLYRQALDRLHQLLNETFAVLSERQQLAMIRSLRRTLDGYLSLAAPTPLDRERVYPYVLAWKGLVFTRQRQAHLTQRPELTAMLSELQSVSSRLATLLYAGPSPGQEDVWRRQVARLSSRKEQQEAELARQSAEYQSSKQNVTLDLLKASLPADAALVDLLQYDRSEPQASCGGQTVSIPCLAAFVIRPGRLVARVDLGPVEPIDRAVSVWRERFGRRRLEEEAAAELRRRVWLPLEPHVAGVATVIVSPDGSLARFPLAALPGKQPGTYLIEDLAVAVIPSPQALPGLKSSQAASSPSLLLVGDVDYDQGSRPQASGNSKTSGPSRGGLRGGLRFDRLESTRGELLAVRDSFEAAFARGTVHLLRRDQATEEAFRQEASACRYLHLATHGFFLAPEDASGRPSANAPSRPASPSSPPGRRDLASLHPGLLSGLALAGANRGAPAGGDDGLLTAEEAASLNLPNADLCVLSACDTGLGPLAGGEGVLGLQRAFHVAGARTVIASLWKVDDDATRQLMEQFYENLWTRKMGKLEALRQAQLWMLRGVPPRGLVLLSEGGSPPAQPGSKPSSTRRAPFYWAAFVLSGDWTR